jgi:hypothetical protein
MAATLAIRAGLSSMPGVVTRVQLPQPTDSQLILRVTGGDRDAFEQLHGRYARAVLGPALRRLGDRGRAEDATRDVFVAIAAGPPPEAIAAPLALERRRRRGAALAVAAVLAVAAFALGASLSNEGSERAVDYVAAMEGTSAAPDASGSLAVFDVDTAGNWPMELTVSGLEPAASGAQFELWLTREGELEALCGALATNAEGSASVPMNAPYVFDETVGWVVVERGATTALLTT